MWVGSDGRLVGPKTHSERLLFTRITLYAGLHHKHTTIQHYMTEFWLRFFMFRLRLSIFHRLEVMGHGSEMKLQNG